MQVETRTGVVAFDRQSGFVASFHTIAVIARAASARLYAEVVSSTIFREAGYRFFFSREESRPRVHVQCTDGEAKFWLEPVIEVAQNSGLSDRQLRAIRGLIEVHANEIRVAWAKHFGG